MKKARWQASGDAGRNLANPSERRPLPRRSFQAKAGPARRVAGLERLRVNEKFFTTDGHGFTRIGKRGPPGLTRIARIIANRIREIRVSPLSVFIRVHPWLRKKLCGSLRPRRLPLACQRSPLACQRSCVEGLSVGLRFRRAVPLHCYPKTKTNMFVSAKSRGQFEGLQGGRHFALEVLVMLIQRMNVF